MILNHFQLSQSIMIINAMRNEHTCIKKLKVELTHEQVPTISPTTTLANHGATNVQKQARK